MNFFTLCGFRLFLALTVLLISMPAATHALTLESDQQLEYADSLFNLGQYMRAAEEYQRFTFFFPDHPHLRSVVFKSAEAFLLAKEADNALTIFKSLSTTEPLDELAVESYFKMAECYIAMNAPTQAVVQLNNLITINDDPDIRDRANYRIAWIHIDLTDWGAARQSLDRISPSGRQRYDYEQLTLALSKSEAIPLKNPSLAGTLSIVPGAGQLYCRRYEDALIAFAVNLGLIWAASDAFDNEQYGLGGLISFVGLGFYVGNIYSAVNSAHKYNYEQERRFLDQLQQHRLLAGTGPQAELASQKAIMIGLTIPF